MNRRRPILFWPLAVASAATAVWWSLHVPYKPERLYTAIPAHAEYVSTHRNLASRWGDVSANPLTRSFFASANMSAKEMDALNRDPQFRDWLTRLASDEFVMAWVPNLADGRGGFVFTSWLGGRSQRLRMGLQLSSIPGITFAGTRRGWPVWIASPKMFKGGDVLAFSLVEGMLVASYCRSPRGIETVLSCVDGRYPSLALREKTIPSPGGPPDRGWYRLPGASAGILDGPRLEFSLATFSSNKLAGDMHVPASLLKDAAPLSAAPPAALAALQTDLPAAVLVASAGNIAGWITDSSTSSTARALSELLRGLATGPVFASLFTGDYRGTLFNMRLPALTLAASSENAPQLPSRVSSVLEEINAAKPWALSLVETAAPPQKIWSVASADRRAWYSSSEPGDRVSFASGPDWLLAASSAAAWSNVVRDAVLRETRPQRLVQAAQAAASRKAAAYAWINLPESAPAIRQGVGSWSLRLRAEKTDSAQNLRLQINEISAWIFNLKTLGQLELAAFPSSGGGTRIQFETTPAAP